MARAAPAQVTDPNDNGSAVRFDALGLVTATAVMGKDGETDLREKRRHTGRSDYQVEYDLFNWVQNRQPNFVHTFAREQHRAFDTRWQESAFRYTDGVGREVMKKIQAEPGKVRQLDSAGNVIEVDTSPQLRWVGTGKVVFDNKGNPIKKYEPFSVQRLSMRPKKSSSWSA